MKKTLLLFLKSFLALTVVFFIILGGIVAGSLFGYIGDTPLLDIQNLNMNLTSIVYYTDADSGKDIELERLFDRENRIWADIGKIPADLQHAFVAIEDERFYTHRGFDLKRITGAALAWFRRGEAGYGASTITQQLIKNITSDDEVSVRRKVQEIYRAYNLEKQLSKNEILELYLNTIYLSQQCNGVEAAANVYFGKEVDDLSLAECVSIAAITQFPTKYDPFQNPENNKKRRLVVLAKMLDLGYITQEEHDGAAEEDVAFINKVDREKTSYQSYFVDAVIDELLAALVSEKGYTKAVANKILYSGGLKIYCTMDPAIQSSMDAVYQDAASFPKAPGNIQPESAMVIMDPRTGFIKALVGGRGEKTANRTLNRATQTLRQPGSTIKPLSVYSPAIEYGKISPSTVVTDSPVTFGNWSPRNDDHKFRGNITIRSALASSVNVVAVKVLNFLSVDTSYEFVTRNFHVTSLVKNANRGGKIYSDKNLASLALGGLTDGVSVLEMAAAYVPFDNRGMYMNPTTFTKVVDANGNVLFENRPRSEIAISEQTAYQITSMLQGVVNYGTGVSAKVPGMSVAGKTGTTSENNDRWFVGYTPYYVGAVWFGFDQPKSLSFVRGGNPSAIVFRKVMSEVHKKLPNKEFEQPAGLVTYAVCAESGQLPTENCPEVKSEIFTKGGAPTQRCQIHSSKSGSPRSSLIDYAWLEKQEKEKEEQEATEKAEREFAAETPATDENSGAHPVAATNHGAGNSISAEE